LTVGVVQGKRDTHDCQVVVATVQVRPSAASGQLLGSF
jgi:hypothetical protein